MSEIKKQYIDKSYISLMNYQVNSIAHRRRFATIDAGLETPVDAKNLDNLPGGKVILSREVFENLLTVNSESEKAQAEFSYLLTGTTEGQTVRFDTIKWCRNQGNARVANFGPLLKDLDSYVNSVQQTSQKNCIVCNGHTHPKGMSLYAEDFSIGDMAGFMQLKEENRVFKDGTIDLCGGIMSDLNFNFCFYDDKVQNFYKFKDVVLELESGAQIPLSCYDRKISRSDIENRMVGTEEKQPNSFRDNLRQGAPSLDAQARFATAFSSQAEHRRRLALEYSQDINSERVE